MIRKALGLSFMVGVASVFTFACGSDDTGPRYPTADSFCDSKATLECSKTSVGVCGVKADVCKSARKSACLTAASTATSQGRTYNNANAEDCLDKDTASYDKPTDKASGEAYKASCEKVFQGSVKKGDQCHTAYDCAGTTVCDLEKADPRCADKRTVTEGDGCANSGDICDTGLFCDISGTPICRKANAVNAACSKTSPCVDTAYCLTDPANPTGSGTCVGLSNTGDNCQADTQCVTTYCNPDIGNKCAVRQFPSLYTTDKGTCKDYGQ